jgi:hypothetical protein
MSWFYEIRDANKGVIAAEKGYLTQQAAVNAGRKKARQLKASRSLPGNGDATIKTGQHSELLLTRK